MKFFKVLPTNPDFLALTYEHIAWMGAQLEIDERELKRKARKSDEEFYDPTFDEWAEKYERGETRKLFDFEE